MELPIRNVSNTYPGCDSLTGTVQALKQITLSIPCGMYGLLGPNGAGKSTLMRTLASLQAADEGGLGELDLIYQQEALREALDLLPPELENYPDVRAEDLLESYALRQGIASRPARREVVETLLRQTRLWEVRRKTVGGLTAGMRQRLGVAIALLGNPRLVIVDEPTEGLDPAERGDFLNLLSELSETCVVLLSTHRVDDVARLCTRMAIIDQGEIRLEARPLDAVRALRGRIWRQVVEKNELARVERAYQVLSTRRLGGQTVVRIYSENLPGGHFELTEPDLEDVYFSTLAGYYRPCDRMGNPAGGGR